MSALWLDVRYALRMMAKAPGLTAVLVITLALGIGASTTIFSVVHSIVLKPLPYAEPDRLVRVHTEFHGELEAMGGGISAPEYNDLRLACRSCSSVAAWTRATAVLSGGERPVRVDATWASHTLLPTLGVAPQLGRWFDATENRPGDPAVILLGDGVWRRAFGADPGVVGRRILVDAIPMTVIGVMPPGFDFLDSSEAWIPNHFGSDDRERGYHSSRMLVRLAPGATLAGFRAELAALAAVWRTGTALHRIDPVEHPMVAAPLQSDLVGSISPALWVLQGAVLLLLAIAIVNIASLLLARSETRTREVAVRHALGASRRRLVRQFVTESLILGALGGALGIFGAVWAIDAVIALLPPSAPRASEIELDGAAFAFAVACSLGAALLFGLAPIFHARRTDLHGALKDGSPQTTGSRARLRVRRALVVVEIALAIVLVVACTVMARSFIKLQRTELGFAPDHLLTFEIEIPYKVYTEPGARITFWAQLEAKLSALPGATSATLLGTLPLRESNGQEIVFPGRPPSGDATDHLNVVGTNAFATLGARMVRGRPLLPSDTANAPQVIAINEALAAKFFPGVDPIGRQIHLHAHESPALKIVGVVRDIKQAHGTRPAGTEIFLPLLQSPYTSMVAVVRTAGDPMELAPAAHAAVHAIDPTLPISHVRSMDDVLWEAIALPRFLTFLMSGFAALALLLAAIGIYGVMAHTVAQRTHEIGVRVALGAQTGQVRSMILRQAGGLVAIGVALGLAAAIALQLALDARLTGLFYGDGLTQPLLLAGVAAVVATTALLATWIPVRRATRIEPMIALRSE